MLRMLPAGAGLPPTTGHALWLGTAQKPSSLALATAFGLGLIGIVMAAYLIVGTR